MARLKDETAQQHRHAESRPLQRSLGKGDISRELYRDYLGQLYHLHAALEEAVQRCSDCHRGFGIVIKQQHARQPQLCDDLTELGTQPQTIMLLEATSAAVARIEEIAQCQPVALLGSVYVLEGSNNGSKFLARALAGRLGLAPGRPGLSYFDPYGDQQRDVWMQFKTDMDAVGFDATEQDAIIGAAHAMFDDIAAISDDVHRADTAGATV
jgi:heme oxygenase